MVVFTRKTVTALGIDTLFLCASAGRSERKGEDIGCAWVKSHAP